MKTRSEQQTLEAQVVERTEEFLQDSIQYVDMDRLQASNVHRFVLCGFAFGTVNAFSAAANLKDKQIREIFVTLMGKIFQWTPEQLSDVAQWMVDSTEQPEFQQIMQEGENSITNWLGNGDGSATHDLADLLDGIDEE